MSDDSSNEERDEKAMEKRIMVMMRQVLSAVARDTVPPPGMKHPLSEDTIQGIRECLALISARERELNVDLDEEEQRRPRYADEAQSSTTVELDTILKK